MLNMSIWKFIAYDDVYSTTVIQRTSYTFEEIVFGARFIAMYHESLDGRATILDSDKLNIYKTH